MEASDRLSDKISTLFQRSRAEESNKYQDLTKTYIGVVTEDSTNGRVSVEIDGNGTSVSLPTTVDAKNGDSVLITSTVNNGLDTLTVTGVVGGGDRLQTDIQGAVEKSNTAVEQSNTAVEQSNTAVEQSNTAVSTATDAHQKAQAAQEQVVDVSTRLDQNTDNLTATIESKVALVQQDVDSNTDDVSDLNKRLTSEIKTRRSFMRFGEESSDPTLTLGQTDSPAQVKLTNKQLQFLYLSTVVAYMGSDALLINNAQILQQLMLGGFAVVPRSNGNLSLKWVG